MGQLSLFPEAAERTARRRPMAEFPRGCPAAGARWAQRRQLAYDGEVTSGHGGRPRGVIREELLRAIREGGPGTSLDLRIRACTGRDATVTTLNNMVRAGEVAKLRKVRVPGVNRPVPVYGLPEFHRTSAEEAGLALARTWLGSPGGRCEP